ncbi:POTRA domain-containing protein [Fimbriiglobus ruber]|uniref:Outer membrane protein assembly factor YaeT n=1 Tax=Fimbriiglobus ruber TaxID=1908690 RepID=A0A225DL37_9BACT|nr:POTRA domain-containing protein [Fimbriiglobus ruber]OWK37879.1 Outer membrane protein assembly factor YaeT precursor [Fimbriiglobus ruber]
MIVPCTLLGYALAIAAIADPSVDRDLAGKIVADIIPVNNQVHDRASILSQMKTRAGSKYDPLTMRVDVYRLKSTRWFKPSGVRVSTVLTADGKVCVFVHVAELSNTVGDVMYLGNKHLSERELQNLTKLRKGSPLDPDANQRAAEAIQNKLRADGRAYATVSLLEGDRPSDNRIVFGIAEGPIVAPPR